MANQRNNLSSDDLLSLAVLSALACAGGFVMTDLLRLILALGGMGDLPQWAAWLHGIVCAAGIAGFALLVLDKESR